ncbi:YoaK family protein [Maribacter sp. HS]|uniref:YoaK family protein n=1 Tax=Maribacter sp. HS TaxID=3110480 RepID=UPI003A873BDC
MLRKFSNYRSFLDNIRLGILTAFIAGMVNVISVTIFFSFTSNVTGHYAILAQEISKGNWYQGAVVLIWIFLFFAGNFTSNCLIIHNNTPNGRYIAHAIPVFLEMACLMFVGTYLQYFYTESLQETEILVGAMLFAMGLQNGLTASITNAKVKTTHLTGLTTDLGILLSMFTKKEYRKDKNLVEKGYLLFAIMLSYMGGGIASGVLYLKIQNATFIVVGTALGIVLLYDYSRLQITKIVFKRRMYNKIIKPN